MKVHIRQMSMDDLEKVQAIDRLSFSLPWPASAYLYELTQNPSSLCRVAEVISTSGTPQLAGMAVIWLVVDEAHIATLVSIQIFADGIARRYWQLSCVSIEKA
jgi:ribosomal protein S18 acetylase RimI-like enzyme